jgi:hypothetical protein
MAKTEPYSSVHKISPTSSQAVHDADYRRSLARAIKHWTREAKPVCPIEISYVTGEEEGGRSKTEIHSAMLLSDGTSVIKAEWDIPCGCHYLEFKRLDTAGRKIDAYQVEACRCNRRPTKES